MNFEETARWVESLKPGDIVASRLRYDSNHTQDTVVAKTPSGRVKLASGSEINPNGRLRGYTGHGSTPIYEPWTAAMDAAIHREKLIYEISSKTRPHDPWKKFTTDQLERIAAIIAETKE